MSQIESDGQLPIQKAAGLVLGSANPFSIHNSTGIDVLSLRENRGVEIEF